MDIELYNREVEAIFTRFPSFQKVGGSAYKPGLESMQSLCGVLGSPHKKFRSVHVAGTNGKGSTSHMLAAALGCLEKEGGRELKVGLYTSPHLIDFRERMKVSCRNEDGSVEFLMPSREYVYSFLTDNKVLFEEVGASFFEITTILAFCWFAHEGVDIAVVECGLGGRLDATNILTPLLSIITNIGLDHCEFLGNTIESIALEKAGIIKRGIPVVIGEKSGVGDVFSKRAAEMCAPIIYAEEYSAEFLKNIDLSCFDLKGKCQEKNVRNVVAAIEKLYSGGLLGMENICFSAEKVLFGMMSAASVTGLRGRWESLCRIPYVVCDTGHNAHGFSILGRQIVETGAGLSPVTGEHFGRIVMIFGVVADKDLDAVAKYLPSENKDKGVYSQVPVLYYFVNAAGTRALPAEKLKEKMGALGFDGQVLGTGNINEALSQYMNVLADKKDFVFIGGSTFVVAEALNFFK